MDLRFGLVALCLPGFSRSSLQLSKEGIIFEMGESTALYVDRAYMVGLDDKISAVDDRISLLENSNSDIRFDINPSTTQGIEGGLRYCSVSDTTSPGCDVVSIPLVCFRTSLDLATYANRGQHPTALPIAAYALETGWFGSGRGSGGPCQNGIFSLTPARTALSKANSTYLHWCGRKDATSTGCRANLDGWPIVCLRTDSTENVQMGGWFTVNAHFTGGEWRGVGRGSGGACSAGVYFFDYKSAEGTTGAAAVELAAGNSLVLGIEGELKTCPPQLSPASGCDTASGWALKCHRPNSDMALQRDHAGGITSALSPAAYASSSAWYGTRRGTSGPCSEGVVFFRPTLATGRATQNRLAWCSKTDKTSVGCRPYTDGWPVVCLRSDSNDNAQRGGWFPTDAQFDAVSSQWLGVARGTGSVCTHGVYFFDYRPIGAIAPSDPVTLAPGNVLTFGIAGSLKTCGLTDTTSSGCSLSQGWPIKCHRADSDYRNNPNDRFWSSTLSPAAYASGGKWYSVGRGTGGPCQNGVVFFTPSQSIVATSTTLHWCNAEDAFSVGCRFVTDGWPIVCIRATPTTAANLQAGGWMAQDAYFSSGKWRAVASTSACSGGVWFYNPR